MPPSSCSSSSAGSTSARRRSGSGTDSPVRRCSRAAASRRLVTCVDTETQRITKRATPCRRLARADVRDAPRSVSGAWPSAGRYEKIVIQAIELAKARGEVGNSLAWSRTQEASYIPSPVAHEGRLYFLRDTDGILNCLDAAT